MYKITLLCETKKYLWLIPSLNSSDRDNTEKSHIHHRKMGVPRNSGINSQIN